jgi:hypothetical protein
MPANLTEHEFSRHLNTNFRVRIEASPVIELKLVEVNAYPGKLEQSSPMERFSACFSGPIEPGLPQHTYLMEHEQMGEFEIFLVPIARDENGFLYEAVFNYYKDEG